MITSLLRGEGARAVAEENKIMTVSYGTFSCTLEGFDDPMGTMREMAEYFRDLSAHDRFFGAEPVQADPEMMNRLALQQAQQQAPQQIAAQPIQQAQPVPQPIPQAAPEAPQPSAEPAPASPMQGAAAPLAAAVASTPKAANPTLDVDADDLGDSVAEKLKRLRSAVTTEDADNSDYSEDEHATEAPITEDAVALDTNADTEDFDTGLDVSDGNDEVLTFEDLTQEDTAEVDATEVDAAKEVTADVITSEAAFTDESIEDEDFGVENLLDGVEMDDEIDAVEIVSEREPVAVEEISREELNKATGPLVKEVPNSADPHSLTSLPSDVIKAGSATKIEARESPAPKPEVQNGPVAGNYDSFSDFARSFATSEDSEKNEFDFDGSSSAAPAATSAPATQAPEAEAPETEIIEAEAAETMITPAAAPEPNATRADKQARRDAMTETEDEDQALERLMSATSSRLEDSEGSVRRASIAHLKAAVAATKADSSIADAAAAKEEAELDQYRADLARVVRPGKGSNDADTSKLADRPSPLVLVSEQRIDESDALADDVRPRRVGSTAAGDEAEKPAASVQEMADEVSEFEDDTNIFADNETEAFTAYIARHQVKELPEMLEAAAAHYSFVENVQQFTRPMLMRKVSTIAPDNAVSREDGLRAFGTLLREGKIVKDEDGKFVIASNSRFMREARIAGE